VSTDISEEHIAYIFKVKEISSARNQRASKFLAELISSTLKMEAICSSEMSVDTQRTTRRYMPEDETLHNHRCENLKSYIYESWFQYFGKLVLYRKAAEQNINKMYKYMLRFLKFRF
jgi:hypothetical protein